MGGWEGIKKLNFVMMKCAAPGATSGISVDKYQDEDNAFINETTNAYNLNNRGKN